MSTFFIILLIFIVGTVLFSKAAGTLNPGKLNIVSCVYYIFVLQSFVGTALIMLGNDKHYTLNYLVNRQQSIEVTIFVVFVTFLLFPTVMLMLNKMFKMKVKHGFKDFLSRETEFADSKIWSIVFFVAVIGSCFMLLGFLIKVGYIPLVRLVRAPAGFNYATERVRIDSTYFLNPYICNIVLFTIIPLLSYVSFAYAMLVKGKKWKILFGITFALSAICKTYKFEKTPLIFHLLVFVLIFIYVKGGIKLIYMGALICVMGVLLLGFYMATGFSGTFLDIYNGPLGRTIFTEVGTLAYCFDLFPNVFGFLGGRSFTPTVLKILGMRGEQHLRSAKLTMAFYGSEKVYDGTAGVMNTLFVGEAYANWGYIGIFISIVWVAFVISFLMWLIFKLKKTPSTIALMAILSIRIATMLKGGFCDFVYNFNLWFTISMFLGIHFFFENTKWLSDFLKRWEFRGASKGERKN